MYVCIHFKHNRKQITNIISFERVSRILPDPHLISHSSIKNEFKKLYKISHRKIQGSRGIITAKIRDNSLLDNTSKCEFVMEFSSLGLRITEYLIKTDTICVILSKIVCFLINKYCVDLNVA